MKVPKTFETYLKAKVKKKEIEYRKSVRLEDSYNKEGIQDDDAIYGRHRAEEAELTAAIIYEVFLQYKKQGKIEAPKRKKK